MGAPRGCGMDGMGSAPGREQCPPDASSPGPQGSFGINPKTLTPYLKQPGAAGQDTTAQLGPPLPGQPDALCPAPRPFPGARSHLSPSPASATTVNRGLPTVGITRLAEQRRAQPFPRGIHPSGQILENNPQPIAVTASPLAPLHCLIPDWERHPPPLAHPCRAPGAPHVPRR